MTVPPGGRPAIDQQTLVVVGNGMVGFRLCRQLVESGAVGGPLRVVVFGEEPRPAYDRIRLTELLAGRREEDLTLAPRDWYEAHGIELFLADPVVALDRPKAALVPHSVALATPALAVTSVNVPS